MKELLIAIAATFIGSVLATLGVRLLGGRRPPAQETDRNVTVSGIGNNTLTDNSVRTEINVVEQNLGEPRDQNAPTGTAEPPDTTTQLVLVAVAAAAAVLGYLLSWPIIIGALSGVALATVVAAWAALARSQGSSGPQVATTVAATVGCAATAATVWFVVRGAPWHTSSVMTLESAVIGQFPAFGDDFAARLNLITTEPAGILQILGWDGARFLLLQLGGIAVLATVLGISLACVIRWWSFQSVLAGRRITPGRVTRAAAFLRYRHIGAVVSALAVLSLTLSSGAAARIIDEVAQVGAF
ncbi:MAG: hypothetical protein ACK5H2_08040 [Beutenbergiaceae bacterium]